MLRRSGLAGPVVRPRTGAAPQAVTAPDAAAAAAPEGGGEDGGVQANAADVEPPTADALAALVQALRRGNAAAQLTAAETLNNLARRLRRRKEEHASMCDVLVERGAVGLLLRLLSTCSPEDERALSSAEALMYLASSSTAVRQAVLAAGGIELILRTVHADVRCRRDATLPAMDVLRYCMRDASVCDACAADAAFNQKVVEILDDDETDTTAVTLLCQCLGDYVQHSASARTALRAAQCFPALAALMTDPHEHKWRNAICHLLVWVQEADGGSTVAIHAALFREGVYAACMALLGAATGSVDFVETTSEAHTLNMVAEILCHAFDESEALRPVLRQYVLIQPGALAGMAHAARICRAAYDRRHLVGLLLRLRHDDLLTLAVPGLWLLDAHFAACAVIQLGGKEATVLPHFLARWRSADTLRALASPLALQALPAAVSLACLATENACFRELLASRSRLETLCDALVAAAVRRNKDEAESEDEDAKDAPADKSQPSLQWQLQVFQEAIKSAVGGARLTAVAAPAADNSPGDEPSAKRQRTSVTLSAADVNVRRRDSTVLLIGGQPFFAHGAVLEAHSSLLADALRDAETLDPIALPLPAGVPAELHYRMFTAAVEHAYTGGIAADMSAEELLPLFCLADHLQMDSLCAWCVARMTPLLVADVRMLETVWAVALARSCDALCDACASAWLVAATSKAPEATGDESGTTLLDVLSRTHAACDEDTSVSSQLARVLRAALLARAAEEGAAAAA
jgi:hypothetical protein